MGRDICASGDMDKIVSASLSVEKLVHRPDLDAGVYLVWAPRRVPMRQINPNIKVRAAVHELTHGTDNEQGELALPRCCFVFAGRGSRGSFA